MTVSQYGGYIQVDIMVSVSESDNGKEEEKEYN